MLRSEFDAGGHDLVLTLGEVTRHIQMKSSRVGARTASQTLNTRLLERPSGCFVWLVVTDDLHVDQYLFLGAPPGQPLAISGGLKTARNARANALGYKAERSQHRVIPRKHFTRFDTLADLVDGLLGDTAAGPLSAVTPPAPPSHAG